MMFIAIKTKDGVIKGKLSFYCRMLGVSRQGFYKYLAIKDRPWKYQDLADAMRVIHAEDECNDTYGRIRMYQALLLKNPTGIKIPSERTVYRVMDEIGLVHRPKRKPNGITKADREARKSDDLLKREFKADKPLEKCVTDITEIKAKDGKLYVSAIFDCFDSSVLGLAMETNMKATLCEHTLDNAYLAHPDLLKFGGSKENYEKAADKLCVYAAKNKVPLEINMLGMREHRHYPNFEFFKIAARHNCDIILGCDAHEPKGVCDLESAKTALEWCRELGLNRIEYPELKKPCRK